MQRNNKSKFLSYVLRHNPGEFGLTLEEGGWVSVDKLMTACNFTLEELKEIVATDQKKRYSFDGNGRIRANQGHSIDVEMNFNEMIPPDVLYHGTATRFVDSILKDGIKKMNRQYVHLSFDIKTASVVGARHGSLALLPINSKKMHEDGFKFFKSENGVWLTEIVPVKYIMQGEV